MPYTLRVINHVVCHIFLPSWLHRVTQNYCRAFNNFSYTIHLR